MATPADELTSYNEILNSQIFEINKKSIQSSSIVPNFSDFFETPKELPSDTSYFNGYSNRVFNTDKYTSPFNNYLETAKNQLLNCEFPSLPNFSQLLPTPASILSLLNINIFDFALKKLSVLPKVGAFALTDIVGSIASIAQSALNSQLGPISGYLKNISNCIKKF
jgi:hypothetical protein